MKKFFIILCGLLVTGNAFGAKELQTPSVVSDTLKYAWYISPWEFNRDLTNKFMQSWMIGETHQSGACGTNDEGAGVAIIATNIFSNGQGAEFCTRQIQSANAGRKSWIDFYATKDYQCAVFCKSGFYGPRCDNTGTPKCDHTDYTSWFDNIADAKFLDTTSKYCNDKSKIKTSDTPVLHAVLNQNSGTFSQVIVLGVLEVKPHAIIVGPVDIHANRKAHSTSSSWISSVKGNGNQKVLCAAGWVANSDETDCIPGPSSSCATTETMLNNLCPGFNQSNYTSSEHSLNYDSGKNCYYFQCQTNKGFRSQNDRTCVECDGGVLAYVNADGVCDKCLKGEYPNSNRNGCLPKDKMNTYSQVQMKSGPNSNRECWTETDPARFGGCVHGCPDTKSCYIDGNCKACD